MPKEQHDQMNPADQLRLIQKEIEMLVKRRQTMRMRKSQMSTSAIHISKMMLQKYKDFAKISRLITQKLQNAKEEQFDAIAENIRRLIEKLFKKYRDINPNFYKQKKNYYLARVKKQMAKLLYLKKKKMEEGKYNMKVGFAKKREGENLQQMIDEVEQCMNHFDLKRYDRLSKRVYDHINLFTREEANEILRIYDIMQRETDRFSEADRRRRKSKEIFAELSSATPVKFKVTKALELLKENLFAEGIDDVSFAFDSPRAKDKQNRQKSATIHTKGNKLVLYDDYGYGIKIPKRSKQTRAKSRDVNSKPFEKKHFDDYVKKLNKTSVQRLNKTMGGRAGKRSMKFSKTVELDKKSVDKKSKNWFHKKSKKIVHFGNDSSMMGRKMDEGFDRLENTTGAIGKRGRGITHMKHNSKNDQFRKKNTFQNKFNRRISFGDPRKETGEQDFVDFARGEEYIDGGTRGTGGIRVDGEVVFGDMDYDDEDDVFYSNQEEFSGQGENKHSVKTSGNHLFKGHPGKKVKIRSQTYAGFRNSKSQELQRDDLDNLFDKEEGELEGEEFYEDEYEYKPYKTKFSKDLNDIDEEDFNEDDKGEDENIFIDDMFEIKKTDFRRSKKLLYIKKKSKSARELVEETDMASSKFFKQINKYLYSLNDDQLIRVYDLIEHNKENPIIKGIFENTNLDNKQKFLSILKASYKFQKFPSRKSISGKDKIADPYAGVLFGPEKMNLVMVGDRLHTDCYSFFCKVKGQENICPMGYANSKILDGNGNIVDTKTKDVIFKNPKTQKQRKSKKNKKNNYDKEQKNEKNFYEGDKRRSSFKKLVGEKMVYDILIANNRLDSHAYDKEVMRSTKNQQKSKFHDETISVTDHFEEFPSDNKVGSFNNTKRKSINKSNREIKTESKRSVNKKSSRVIDNQSKKSSRVIENQSKKSSRVIERESKKSKSKRSIQKQPSKKDSKLNSRKSIKTNQSIVSEKSRKSEKKISQKNINANNQKKTNAKRSFDKNGDTIGISKKNTKSHFSKKKEDTKAFIEFKKHISITDKKDSKTTYNNISSELSNNYFDNLKGDVIQNNIDNNSNNKSKVSETSEKINPNISNSFKNIKVSDRMIKMYNKNITDSLKSEKKGRSSKHSSQKQNEQDKVNSFISFTDNSQHLSRVKKKTSIRNPQEQQPIENQTVEQISPNNQDMPDPLQNENLISRTQTMPKLRDTEILSSMNPNFRYKNESTNTNIRSGFHRESISKTQRTVTDMTNRTSKGDYSNYFNLDSEINYNNKLNRGGDDLNEEIIPSFAGMEEEGNVVEEFAGRGVKHLKTVSTPYSDVLIEEESRITENDVSSQRKSYDFNSYLDQL